MLIQILIIFSVFIILVIFVFRLVFRRDLDSAVKSLKHLQEETMLKEGQLSEALNKAKTERVVQVEQGKKEAKSLIEKAQKEIKEMCADSKAKAQQEKELILEDGNDEIEKLKKNFKKDVKDEAVKLAVKMFSQVFEEKRKEHLHHQLIAEFLEELRGVDKEKFTVTTDKGIFTSSLPLSDDETRDLKEILFDKIGSKIDFEEKVDPSIITGIVIEIGDFVVDGSLKNKLNKVILSLEV